MNQEIKMLGGLTIVTVLLIFGAGFFLTQQQSSSPSQPTVADSQKEFLVRDDSSKIGTDSAKVTIVEFSDFQCPACGALYPTLHAILNDYQGKVTFVYRQYPLPMHKNAMVAAEAAEAAGAQGKFKDMHDMLFEKQSEWSESSKPKEIFAQYAQALGLDVEKFRQAVDAQAFKDKIARDQQDGNILGVNSTPTFFINGKRFVGVQSYSTIKNEIDSILNK